MTRYKNNAPIQDPMQQAAVAFAKRLRGNDYPDSTPLFATDTLGLTLWPKQAEIAASIDSNRFTVVEAGHGVGKSVIAAAITCAWLCHPQHREAVVITIAPTWNQVLNVIWRYIQKMHRDAKLPGQVFDTARWQMSPERYALGLSPRKDSAEALASLQGYHSPHLLVILDEGPGLPRILADAAKSLAIGENDRLLTIGNPIEQQGWFYEACNNPGWNHIRVSCLDHPNITGIGTKIPGAVSPQSIEEMVYDHCQKTSETGSETIEWPIGSGQHWLPGPVFQSRVLGIAPSEASDQLISLAWVANAKTWRAEGKGEIVLGFDPSRVPHGDAAAMIARRGGEVLWVKRRRVRTNDPDGELAGWLWEEFRTLGATRAFVDDTGGSGVVSAARGLGVPVIAVNFGAGASQKNRFANKRSECWWAVRDALQGGALSLVDDDLLAGDLTAPKFWYDRIGRILLEPKDGIRTRLGRSPDSGDALSLTFALPDTGSINEGQRQEMASGLKGSSVEKVSRWTPGLLIGGGKGRWGRGGR